MLNLRPFELLLTPVADPTRRRLALRIDYLAWIVILKQLCEDLLNARKVDVVRGTLGREFFVFNQAFDVVL